MYTFTYFTRIHSLFHSSVLKVVWRHSEWIVSSSIGMLLKACRMFIKFIYNVWVSQYHCFTWSFQPMTYICTNILGLTHIEPMFHFWTPENFRKLHGFLKFQAVKNRTLGRYGLRTYLMLLSHCKPMWYFLPPENFRKLYNFLKFSGRVKNGTLA